MSPISAVSLNIFLQKKVPPEGRTFSIVKFQTPRFYNYSTDFPFSTASARDIPVNS